MYGLTVEEASGPPVEVWPDNLLAYNTFVAAATQWRSGMAGPTGLVYSDVESTLRMTRVSRSLWPQVFEDLRLMEDAALETMRAQRKDRKNG
jgi:hypothetical protein